LGKVYYRSIHPLRLSMTAFFFMREYVQVLVEIINDVLVRVDNRSFDG